MSLVSYWDPAHYGNLVLPIEATVMIGTSIFVWRMLRTRAGRGLLIATDVLYLAAVVALAFVLRSPRALWTSEQGSGARRVVACVRSAARRMLRMEYRYPHFKRELLAEDSSFAGGAPPGQPLPDFELPTTEGRRLRKGDLLGKPLLLVFASYT